MKFDPKSEEEVNNFPVLQAGEYPFEVMSAEEKTSQAGNPMIEVKLKVWGTDGAEVHVFDYLVEKVAYKLRHFCFAIGLGKEYSNGTVEADDCVGRGGLVILKVRPAQGEYAEKNETKDYKSNGKPIPPRVEKPKDDVPF